MNEIPIVWNINNAKPKFDFTKLELANTNMYAKYLPVS